MTFFLNEYNPAKQRPAQGPDMAPTGFAKGLGATTSTAMRDSNANFLRQREVRNERKITAEPIARRIGIDDLNAWYQANDAGYDHLRPAPTTVDDFFAMHGPLAADIAFDIARTSEKHNPDKWKDLDLTDTGIEARVTARRIAEYQDEAMIRAMMPRYGGVADLLGGMVGATADVRNLPFLFVGGGGGSFLRVLGREAALNAAAEAVTLPSRFETAKELGKADPNVLETLATAALGGAAFGAVFEGIPRAISGTMRGIEYYRDRTASVPETPHVQAATQAAEDAIIAGEDPFKAADDIMVQAPPEREALIPDETPLATTPEPTPLAPDPITTDVLPAPTGEKPRTLGEVVAGANRAINRKPEGPRPRTLKQFIIDKGGIWKGDDRGDIAALEYRRPGFLKSKKLERSAAGDNGGGASISEMREAARDAGYIGPEATDRDFLDAITDDVKGHRRVISQADHGAEADWSSWDNRNVVKESSPADDYRAMVPEDRGFYVDPNTGLFAEPGWERGLVEDFDRWADERGFSAILLPRERDEILNHLAKNGGEAEYLVERALERELSDAEYAITKRAQNDTQAYVPWGDEADAARSATGESGSASGDGWPAAGTGSEPPADQGRVSAASERTDAGDQLLISGVAPVSQRQRLEARQSTAMRGGSKAMDEGLFDIGARAQMDMFSDQISPKARETQQAMVESLREEIDARGDFSADMGDGKGERSASSVLKELDDDMEFLDILDACGKARSQP